MKTAGADKKNCLGKIQEKPQWGMASTNPPPLPVRKAVYCLNNSVNYPQ